MYSWWTRLLHQYISAWVMGCTYNGPVYFVSTQRSVQFCLWIVSVCIGCKVCSVFLVAEQAPAPWASQANLHSDSFSLWAQTWRVHWLHFGGICQQVSLSTCISSLFSFYFFSPPAPPPTPPPNLLTTKNLDEISLFSILLHFWVSSKAILWWALWVFKAADRLSELLQARQFEGHLLNTVQM